MIGTTARIGSCSTPAEKFQALQHAICHGVAMHAPIAFFLVPGDGRDRQSAGDCAHERTRCHVKRNEVNSDVISGVSAATALPYQSPVAEGREGGERDER